MPVLTLDYRHCDRKRPKFIKHVEGEFYVTDPDGQEFKTGLVRKH